VADDSISSKRSAFFVSDRTGVTAEMLGHSLLTQFELVEFTETTLPFVDTPQKAEEAVKEINAAAARDGTRPIVVSTLVDTEVGAVLAKADGLVLDCFQIFIAPLEQELGMRSSHTVGRSHSAINSSYFRRIDAVNFALAYDDGQATKELSNSDVVLIGVSRCGKTPTCLYLALQYGIRAANYPLIPEDFGSMRLPGQLRPWRDKLFGLTIMPDRLHQIRSERRPGSKYASLSNCVSEVREAETLMRNENLPYLDTTHRSIEELASTILRQANLARHIY
jgi:[pyruvate, water dikinase]-phosphate phosphotransferase / [pyruvate, water dikinase] kinase